MPLLNEPKVAAIIWVGLSGLTARLGAESCRASALLANGMMSTIRIADCTGILPAPPDASLLVLSPAGDSADRDRQSTGRWPAAAIWPRPPVAINPPKRSSDPI